MIGKTTEKAIKAWLALPAEKRRGNLFHLMNEPTVYLVDWDNTTLAKFTIASIVAKRYPRSKKVAK